MVHPLKGVHSLLHRYCPEYVILFDPDIGVIRELELFQALPSTHWQLHVYFMLYSNSIEEQRYVSSIEQENKAFETLIQTKKTMVIPMEQDGKLAEPVARVDTAEERKNASLYEDGTRNNTYEAYASTLPNQADTRRGGASSAAPGTILVDVREFRSSLPSQLHAANLVLQPITLEIADYILTPTLAVERKSVPDLIGSLASGRLYKQVSVETHARTDARSHRRSRADFHLSAPCLLALLLCRVVDGASHSLLQDSSSSDRV
jgi:DNA excision repair protein ERCC-4